MPQGRGHFVPIAAGTCAWVACPARSDYYGGGGNRPFIRLHPRYHFFTAYNSFYSLMIMYLHIIVGEVSHKRRHNVAGIIGKGKDSSSPLCFGFQAVFEQKRE